jgi:5'-deoxynucleotidase YfbR-like HD superfamily hydrolase
VISLNISQEIIWLARKGEILKKIKRTGWALAGVDSARQESVGEHSFGTVLISLLISRALLDQENNIDVNKVMTMATFHDISESMTSDIPRAATNLGGNLLRNGKKEAEKKALQLISKESKHLGGWLADIWNYIEEKESIESRIVLGADMIDMLLHAISLETSGVSPEILDQFFISSFESITQLGIAIIEEIFWELYKQHLNYADRLGFKLEMIGRE